MDNLTPEQRRRNMQAIKSTGTKIEQLLGKALWSKGYRYRKNNKKVFGKPDFTFKKLKIAVFCDSEFWHGKNLEEQKKRIKTNRTYWINKIERNIQRDIEVNQKLTEEGWLVLRFWEKSIKKDLKGCVEAIELAIEKKRQNL